MDGCIVCGVLAGVAASQGPVVFRLLAWQSLLTVRCQPSAQMLGVERMRIGTVPEDTCMCSVQAATILLHLS